MLLEALKVDASDFRTRTGWDLNDRGACLGDICIPLTKDVLDDGVVDIEGLASAMKMPLIHDRKHSVWSLGPVSFGKALSTVGMPPLKLPNVDGELFDVASLRGQKVLMVAWASW